MPTVYVVYLRATRRATGRYMSFEAAHAALRDEAAFNDRGPEDYAIRAIDDVPTFGTQADTLDYSSSLGVWSPSRENYFD